jgi:uncharacterized protein (DUF1499 family)
MPLQPSLPLRALRAALVALSLLVLAGCAGAQMGLFSGTRPADLGVKDGRLAAVRTHLENAVSSDADTPYHRIEPIATGPDPQAAFARLIETVRQTRGARIIAQRDGYLYAEFETRWMKFVDDTEFLLDASNRVIHVRSASRLGRKDFGVNRSRIESLRATMANSAN